MAPVRRTGITCLALSLALACLAGPSAATRGRSGTHPGPGTTPGTGGSASHGAGRIVAVLPDGTLRSFATDFTQVTEDPFTADSNKTEWSADVASGSWAKLDTIRTHSVQAGGIGVTRGLPGRWEVGASLASWAGMGLDTGPVSGEAKPSGFGGGTLSARHTFFGVDSEGVALGAVAAVQVPGSSDAPGTTAFEATFALPFSASLPFDLTFGAMGQVGDVADAADDGHHVRLLASAKLEREIVPRLSAWIEALTADDREPHRPVLTAANAGLSVELGKHVSLSGGVAGGHAGSTRDVGAFGGLGLHL